MIPAYPHCEPLSVSDPHYNKLTNLVLQQYPQACIAMIDRYRNPVLEGEFEARKRELNAAGYGQELSLFHGTKRAYVASICQQGFVPTVGRTMAFGYGIYFARDFQTSWTYSDWKESDDDPMSYVFVCRILPGRICYGTNGQLPKEGCHSSCNSTSIENASIFAIPAANQMLPEYLIRFHKNSEKDFPREPNAPSLKEVQRQLQASLRRLDRANKKPTK